MKYNIKKYQQGSMVIAPELLLESDKPKHWSEQVPASWDWLQSYGRTDVSTDKAINLIKKFEQFRSSTYKDGKGLPTIGYGTRDKKYLQEGRITEEQASAAVRNYITKNIDPILQGKSYYPGLSTNQKVALKSLIYNIGPTGFNKSTKLQEALASGNWSEAMKQMDHGITDKANPGLIERRQLEKNIFWTGTQ